MTTMVSSMAIHKLLSLLGIFGEKNSSLSQIEIKDGLVIDSTQKNKE